MERIGRDSMGPRGWWMAMAVLTALLLMAGCAGATAPAPTAKPAAPAAAPAKAASGEPISIGVPLPLTGGLAPAGAQVLIGIQYATEEVNKAGGLLGRPIKLIVDDNKGEPNQAAAVATKMATQDKVFAFVGGYGSTPDFAALQSIQQYQPIYVHPTGSATRLEEAFGRQPWYFHFMIWDYMRAVTTANFFESLDPKPKTVALAHEDGLYGTDTAKLTAEEITKKGIQVVMVEAFKSGSADFSPVLNKVKSLKPDVFYWVGYTGDNVQMARQAYSLQISPNNLTIFMGAENKRSEFGPAGKNIAIIDVWKPGMAVAGVKEWEEGIAAFKPDNVTTGATAQGYAAMRSLIDAIKAAGAVDRDKVIQSLRTVEFWTPWGPIKYTEDRMTTHQGLKSMVVSQYTDADELVVWPTKFAKTKPVYPAKYGPGN